MSSEGKAEHEKSMDDFVRRQGPAFLAHLLRRVSDELVSGGAAWYPQAGVTAPPRTASTLLLLDEASPRTITDIAAQLRQSHQLVITWVRQLSGLGFVESARDSEDARRTLISLTAEGRAETHRMKSALDVMAEVTRGLSQEIGVDIFVALSAADDALRARNIVARLQAIAAEKNGPPQGD